MILKIGTGLGWRFIDNVLDVEINPDTKQTDNDFPCQHYFINNKTNKIQLIGYRTKTDSPMDFIKVDDVPVYLLNNEGKTVDRLN